MLYQKAKARQNTPTYFQHTWTLPILRYYSPESVLNDLVLCPRANCAVDENSRHHVEKSHHTEGNIEIEEDEIKLAHASHHDENCTNPAPVNDTQNITSSSQDK